MNYDDFKREMPANLVIGAAGFLGTLAAIFMLPRLIRFMVRNYLVRVLAEIIAIATFGLVTEKVAKRVSRQVGAGVGMPERVSRPHVSEPVP